MSHWTARWNVLLNRTATVGRESYQLLHGFVTTRGQFKGTLLDQAKISNQTALSLLQIDKEMGLLRYHGLSGYLREKQWIPSSSKSVIDWNQKYELHQDDDNDKIPKQQAAKIAFMVTGSMRKELTEGLGYEADQIKKMTPLEASLILQHQLPPTEQSERLPVLVEQHEAAVQAQAKQQAEQAEKERLEQEQLQKEQQQKLATTQAQQTTLSLHQPQSTTTFASFASTNIMDDPSYVEQRNKTIWYEVVETNKEDGSINIVGLYLSEKEAQLGLDTRQLFASRHAKEKGQTSSSYSFEIRTTQR